MTETQTLRVAEAIARYGRCLELIPRDPHFANISVGFYYKDGIGTVWTFSQKPGAAARIERIRDQLVALGGLLPVEGTHHQLRFPCGVLHRRPIRFLMMQAVEKDPNYALPEGELAVKDTRTRLTLSASGREANGRWIYTVSSVGEPPPGLPPPAVATRLAMVVSGFVRYGEMEKVSNTEVTFSCGARHDELVRLLLPYARNVSAVDEMLQAAALRGQLTTSTAGFTPL